MSFYSFSQAPVLPSLTLHRTGRAVAKSEEEVLRAGTTLGGHFDPGDLGDPQRCEIPLKMAEKFPRSAAIKLAFSPYPSILGSASYLCRTSVMLTSLLEIGCFLPNDRAFI